VLRTRLGDLLGVDAPVIHAGMSVFTSPELVAAVSNAGGLGEPRCLATACRHLVQVDFLNDIRPVPGTVGYGTRERALRSEFVDSWQQRRDEIRHNPEAVLAELGSAMSEGRMHELVAVAGQSAGLVHAVEPAGEIVRDIVDQAEHVLRGAGKLVT
jgi:NAD(P)H-dependent flavin oxidoreductase YrpB (nitropropane dioxygenase family)